MGDDDARRVYPDRWRVLARTPTETMLATIATSYGGSGREFRSFGRTFLRGRETAETEFVTELSGFVAVNADRLLDEAEGGNLHRAVAQARALDYCRDSMSILRTALTDEERVDFARYVFSCAETTAHVGSEGWLAGLGGQRIGSGERRFLDHLAEALDLS